jgi:acetyl-CoA carboxylase biotin carboxylase subunit
VQKILIANRGAIARRVIRACNELGVASVAVYSDADRGAPYLSEASEAYALPGDAATDTYLNQDALLAVVDRSGADALHPGYGFLAENAPFAQRVIDAGAIFIGPRPHLIASMGDKVKGRELMGAEGFPVFPGSELISDLDQAHATAEELGYPLVVKPSGGGGGMGMMVVETEDKLGVALQQARAIAEKAFAVPGLYLERWITKPRHVEFQIIGDNEGRCIHAFDRECSVQRRHQKLIEESPTPGLDPEYLTEQAQVAATTCARLGYDSLGTVETLVSDQGIGFLEMNTRIQVEHGVTEAVAGIDLVKMQIDLARGGALPRQSDIVREGFAIEGRLYAEDSTTMLPSTGTLRTYRAPEMYGVRVETGYREGQTVSPFYDPLLAKVIAYGTTREQAIGRLSVALKAFEVRGVKTNAQLLVDVLQSDRFLSGDVDTGILDDIRRQ